MSNDTLRVVIKMPKTLHAALRQAAIEDRRALSTYLLMRLEEVFPDHARPPLQKQDPNLSGPSVKILSGERVDGPEELKTPKTSSLLKPPSKTREEVLAEFIVSQERNKEKK